MSDLVERLRDMRRDYDDGKWRQYDAVRELLSEAADALEAKDKEIERLREALQGIIDVPFDSFTAITTRELDMETIARQALKEQDGE